MPDMPYYPLNDFGPVMKGMVIGGMGIFHVFLAQFAIGGGMLMVCFQHLASSRRVQLRRPAAPVGDEQFPAAVADKDTQGEPPGPSANADAARRFLDGYFKFLVLVSFVVGALTGVGMWFTTIQISPRTIGTMVDEFHWIWATEWTFFCVEIISGYAFYRYGRQVDDRARMALLVCYAVAAWFSLFWINGILSWQLTPGRWLEARTVWSGFFNPSFWPSLLYRTVVAMTIAALVACAVINATAGLIREQRAWLINRAARFLMPMIFMPALGVWFMWTMPEDSRSWILGGSPAMTLFLLGAVGASLLIGLYAWLGLIRRGLYINGATATLLLALAFAATAGGEFVREGSRKPYTIREALYANSVARADVAALRQIGAVTFDPYPLRNPRVYPNDQVRTGAKVFRLLCSVCHTMDGVNALTQLTGTWATDQKRLNIAKLQLTKPFMPPFAGSAEELEALVQLLEWEGAGRPREWETSRDPAVIEQIERWMEEAGVAPPTK